MIKEIRDGNELLALVIPNEFKLPGIKFFTPGDYSQQLAYMNHPVGKIIEPHIHNHVLREVHNTQEVLFIKRGKLRVDFYNNSRKYLYSYMLKSGDVILLITSGHGFEVIEEIEMVEVKQGPYLGEKDKTRFSGVAKEKIRFID